MDDSDFRSSETDPQALFEQEVLPLRDSLYRIAQRLTRDRADAEDLVQDTMVNAYRSMGSYKSNTHIMAWLMRIMQHRLIDNHRRRQCRPSEYLIGDINDWQRYGYDHHVASTHDAVESRFAVNILTAQVRAAVQQLPEDLRSAVYYAYVEGRQYKEIARLQRVPVGTVMSRLYRARRQLRELLTEWMPSSCADRQTASPAHCGTGPSAEQPERAVDRCTNARTCRQLRTSHPDD